MQQKDLPQRWVDKIKLHLKEIGSRYNELSADAFRHDVKIKFGDGSNAFFKFAFYWIDENLKEVAVITEHCGYHIFPLLDTKLEMTDFDGNVVKTDDYQN